MLNNIPIKIYKNIDNTLELRYVSRDEKRVSIHNKNIKFYIIDQNAQQVVAYLDALCKAVYEVYQSTEDTNIQKLLDGITDLIKSTIYKLQNLH